jgi:hypothetical protein
MEEVGCTAHKMKLTSMQLPDPIFRVYSGPLMTMPYKLRAARVLPPFEINIESAIAQEGNTARKVPILQLDGRTLHHQQDHRHLHGQNAHHRQKSIAEPVLRRLTIVGNLRLELPVSCNRFLTILVG